MEIGHLSLLLSLSLQNFRNHKKKEINFDPQLTVIVGPNAIGKSSILEAIYIFSRGKSFRASKEDEMVASGEEVGRATVTVVESGERKAESSPMQQSNITTLQQENNETKEKRVEKGELRSETSKQNEEFSSQISNLKSQISLPTINHKLLTNSDALEVVLTHGIVQGKKVARKRFLVNGAGKRFKDVWGRLPVVMFEPQDLMLVLGSPGRRREYLDAILSQIDWQYLQSLTSYSKSVKQRNRVLIWLNEGRAHKDQLEFWDRMILEHGMYLQEKRTGYLTFVNDWLGKESSLSLDFEVEYKPSVLNQERLESHYVAELASCKTLIGPHRDDFVVKFSPKQQYNNATLQQENTLNKKTKKQKNNETMKQLNNGVIPGSPMSARSAAHSRMTKKESLSTFGSRGQQRLGVLALKLVELDYLESQLKTKPLLLLDDIFSELDEENRRVVLKTIASYQSILTVTEQIDFLEEKGYVINL